MAFRGEMTMKNSELYKGIRELLYQVAQITSCYEHKKHLLVGDRVFIDPDQFDDLVGSICKISERSQSGSINPKGYCIQCRSCKKFSGISETPITYWRCNCGCEFRKPHHAVKEVGNDNYMPTNNKIEELYRNKKKFKELFDLMFKWGWSATQIEEDALRIYRIFKKGGKDE